MSTDIWVSNCVSRDVDHGDVLVVIDGVAYSHGSYGEVNSGGLIIGEGF
jgi:hypothetical protein